ERQNRMDNLFKEAYDFIRLGREDEGLAKARLFLQKNPTVWNAWFLTGWALRRLTKWDEARIAFERALELGAEGTDVRNELSICLLELGRVGEARRELEKALNEEPENVKIITNLGAIALRQGRPDEAACFFRTALEIESGDLAATRWLAEVEASG
ncbi:MAG: tetratricopeptide repeat protein, partial [Spirochaetota bacterium]